MSEHIEPTIHLVRCDVSEGLRPQERTVAITTAHGSKVHLRIGEQMLYPGNWLQVLLILDDPRSRSVLIQLPHEADTGESRVWVGYKEFLESHKS